MQYKIIEAEPLTKCDHKTVWEYRTCIFAVTICGRKKTNVTSNVSSSVGSLSVVQLTDRQKKIREMILKDSFISTQQMSVVLSVVKRTVERDLATIEDVVKSFKLNNNNAARARVLRLQKDRLVEKAGEFVDNGTTKAKYKKTGVQML